MIRSLRVFFLTRLLREKLLLVAFVAIGLLIWLSGFSARAGVFMRGAKATTMTLKEQDMWLQNENQIKNAAEKAASQLEASRTLDANRLFVKVRQLATDAGLKNTRNQGTEPDMTNGQFTVHTFTFQVDDADWDSLERFYVSLNQNAPYIGIEQFTLQPRANNPTLLSLVLRVSSVEVTK